MKLLPRHWPDCRVKGAKPARLALWRRSRGAKFGHVSDERAGDDRTDARDAAQQVFLVTPGGSAADGIADLLVERSELLLQCLEQALDALLESWRGHQPEPLALSDAHLDDLASPREQAAEETCSFIRELADGWIGGLEEVSDDRRIDRVGLGSLADSTGELADLDRVDQDHLQHRDAQTRG
jgi:hypothetical protein